MTVYSKLFLIGLTLRVSLPAPLHADLQTVLQKTSASLLDGRLTEAKQLTRASANSTLSETDRRMLDEVHQMMDQLGDIDQYVLEYFQNQVGQNVQVYQDNRLEAFRVTLIRPPGTVLGVKVEHGVGKEVSIELDRIPERQKAALAETMPVAPRGLYLSLVAWEDQDLQLFQRAVGVTDHLSAPLKAEAVRRVQAEQTRRQEKAEAARADAARIRVSGTENREWERFDEDKITRIRCDVIDDSGAIGKGTGDTPVQTEGLQYGLYIPKGYNDNPNTWYPVLFIASPGGNAGMAAWPSGSNATAGWWLCSWSPATPTVDGAITSWRRMTM